MLSTTTTAFLLFASALLSADTFVNGVSGEQFWCVPKAGTSDQQLQANLDYSCASIDCKDIKLGGSCTAKDLKTRAAFAMNTFYQSLGKKQSDCNFKGSAQLVQKDPSTPQCKFLDGKNNPWAGPSPSSRKWCVAKPNTTDKQLQGNIDYVCGSGIDCTPIQPGGACFQPNTVKSHAQYAMNTLYQTRGKQESECNFSGTGHIVTNDPSYGGCKYILVAA